ncbi:MAG: heterodisulfide reductase-related iron-sulfur binding cluster [Pseudohongiellaceae bacterium]
MSDSIKGNSITKEGGLEAPTRHPIDWKSEKFWEADNLNQELERVFDICHGCRRCVSLCNTFPTLFDLVDESDTYEVDGVNKADYKKVVDQCYLCDMCYMAKCPYVPPHEWNVDFPHLMLRAKAVEFKKKGTSLRNKILADTNRVGKIATIPLVDVTINALNTNKTFRKVLEKTAGVHHKASLPKYHAKTLRKRVKNLDQSIDFKSRGNTTGKVALYATCYGNYNSPELGEDFFKVFQHNNIQIELVPKEQCCGMPKLELGDLDSVAQAKETNIPVLSKLVDEGYDLIAPVPSCVLMYKQELPLLFPDDEDILKVQKAFFDPFEYLFLRHKENALKTDFNTELGDVSYQVACHLRAQNVGIKARDILNLVPKTTITPEERCSGHDGTYAVKVESHRQATKIARMVVKKVDAKNPDHFISDCPMAANHIANISETVNKPEHPITLLRMAYSL